jgi:hypothetical protein
MAGPSSSSLCAAGGTLWNNSAICVGEHFDAVNQSTSKSRYGQMSQVMEVMQREFRCILIVVDLAPEPFQGSSE